MRPSEHAQKRFFFARFWLGFVLCVACSPLSLAQVRPNEDPTKVSERWNADDVVFISAGYQKSLAVSASGKVWEWGGLHEAMMPDGAIPLVPYALMIPRLSDVKAASTYHNHTLALKRNGTVWVWGDNGDHQLAWFGYDKPPRKPVRITGKGSQP
jgi:hypothetical protein